MSTEDIVEYEPINASRRERRITIKLRKLRRQLSNSSSEFAEHKSVPPVFESGDEISGVVSLEVKCGTPVTKIRLAVICLCQVRWQTYGNRKSVINLITGDHSTKNNQIYFDRKIILQLDLGKNSGKFK